MDLALLRTFVEVARHASFTRAADVLECPKSRVSASVSQLEALLGTRLFHRTTRSVRLTPDGEELLERSGPFLVEADDMAALFQRDGASLRGRLRVDAPMALAHNLLIPQLPAFMSAHPQIEIELSTSDRRVDPIAEGFDCVLRVGQLQDSRLVAKRLGELAMTNCASPAYLAQYGEPKSLDDLDGHRMVRYAPTLGGSWVGWEYHDGSGYRFRDVPSVLTVTHTDAYQAACRAGLGLIQVPRVGVAAALAEGALIEVLPSLRAEPMPVSLVYPHRRNLGPRVRVFMEWLAQVTTPYLEGEPAKAG